MTQHQIHRGHQGDEDYQGNQHQTVGERAAAPDFASIIGNVRVNLTQPECSSPNL